MSHISNFVRSGILITLVSASASFLIPSTSHAEATSDSTASRLPSGVVAVVNGVDIPRTQVDDVVQKMTAKTGLPDSTMLRNRIEGDLIAHELLRQSAEKQGYGSRPEILKLPKEARTGAEIQLYLSNSVHPAAVTDAQVKASYDAYVSSMGPEDYKASVIVLSDGLHVAKVVSELQQGKAFDVVAREYSVVPSKATGGEVPWVNLRTPVTQNGTNGLPLPVAKAVTGLATGEYTRAPVEMGNRFVFVKLDEKRPAKTPSFASAKPIVERQLRDAALHKAYAQRLGELMGRAQIVR